MSDKAIVPDPDTFAVPGSAFSYDLWTAGTEVFICNVPWDAEYNNVVKFGTPGELKDYLRESPGKHIKLDNISYARPEQDIILDIPVNEAYKYNYIWVHNAATHNDVPGDYFYFIRGVSHVAPQATAFHLQLDVWQSFTWELELGRCFIERSHYAFKVSGVDSADQIKNLLVPEGLDLGSDLVEYFYDINQIKAPEARDPYSIVFLASADLTTSPGDVSNPVLTTSQGTQVILHTNVRHVGVNNRGEHKTYTVGIGSDIWLCPISEFTAALSALKDAPWASKSIYGCYLVPGLGRSSGYPSTSFLGNNNSINKLQGGARDYNLTVVKDMYQIARNYLPARYRGLSKLLTSPYNVIEMTTFTGTSVILKPEFFATKELSVRVGISNIPPTPRTVIFPVNYMRRDLKDMYSGAYLDSATLIANFPSLPIVSDSYTAFMAENKNSLAAGYASADWGLQKANMGASTAFSQAMLGIDAANQQARLGQHVNNMNAGLASDMNLGKSIQAGANSAINGIASALQGNVGGGLFSGAMGVGNAFVDYNLNQHQITQSTAINNYELGASNQINTNLSRQIANSNLSLAKAVASGDRAMAIQSLNARVQDAKMLQPGVSGQLGGDFLTLILEQGFTVNFRFKRIDDSALVRVGEYWLRYGYALNRYAKPSTLMPMSNFTYWKMADVNFARFDCPELYKNTIAGIFMRGTTIWKKPRDIVYLDIADNELTAPKEVL